jgi:hypothetical protein
MFLYYSFHIYMPYIVEGYEVVGTIKENNCNLQIVNHKIKYVPAELSKEELKNICNNVYEGTLNIKNKDYIFEYIDNICYKYDLGLIQKFEIIYFVLSKRSDLSN